jgi:hypothetical protein
VHGNATQRISALCNQNPNNRITSHLFLNATSNHSKPLPNAHRSRLPEVVEWYYQHQSEVQKKTSFLSHELAMDFVISSGHNSNASSSGGGGLSLSTPSNRYLSKLHVSMTPDRQGLLFRISPTQGSVVLCAVGCVVWCGVVWCGVVWCGVV